MPLLATALAFAPGPHRGDRFFGAQQGGGGDNVARLRRENTVRRAARVAPVPAEEMAAPADIATPEAVLEYWFRGSEEEQKTRHWKGLPETDDEIRAKFLPTWEAASAPSSALAAAWAKDLRSALALIIVWDQFSRSLWRGDGARSFGNDEQAGALSMELLKSGKAAALAPGEMRFLKMPLLHTEKLEIQRWNAAQPGANEHVQGHLEVLERFGRFPKRNAALGRESTPEELAYMASDEAQGRPY